MPVTAIRVHRTGAPAVLTSETLEIGRPGLGEVVVENRAIGVNFTDVYLRSGAFAPPTLPFTPGKEGAGVVIAVGEDVSEFAPGDRVAYVETLGAYAEQTLVPARLLVKLPEAISFEIAAASLLKGLTAQYLLRSTFQVRAGHTVLVHAAAGGVGSILTQWAKYLGATVIGTVGSAQKALTAIQNGCDYVIDYHRENFVTRIYELTDGKKCDVVYDSVGKMTFPGSLDCLKPFGHFVSFGFASGKIPPFDILMLLEKGSLTASWPGLTMHVDERQRLLDMSNDLFQVISTGAVKIPNPTILPLSDATKAHERLETRASGTMILVP